MPRRPRIEIEDGRVVRVHTPDEVARAARHDLVAAAARDGRHRLARRAPPAVRDAAQGLRYRDFLTVALVLDGEDLFPDNWIYIHEEHVEVGRIQNYRSWSPWMVPDPDTACVGLEYFCFKGDDLWTMSDDDLVALATRELDALGLATPDKVRRGHVVRVPHGLPDVRRATTPSASRRSATGWTRSRASSRSAATACTATTTPTTRCCRRCARWTTSSRARRTTSGRSTSSRPTTRSHTDADAEQPYREVPSTQYEREPLAGAS